MNQIDYATFLEQKRQRHRALWDRVRAGGQAWIYALIDPRTQAVRYIGKSIRPFERLANHCNEQPSAHWRSHWLQQLQRLGLRPQLAICSEVLNGEDWRDVERRWIAFGHARGWTLTNCTSGGDGVSGLPAETRARMALTWTGRKHRPETLLKLSARSRGRMHTEAYKAHMRQIMTGRIVTWGDRLRDAVSKLSPDQVREIRAQLAAGRTQSAIARDFSVDKGTISNIHRRVCYGHIE